jgi:hypothetical protein
VFMKIALQGEDPDDGHGERLPASTRDQFIFRDR